MNTRLLKLLALSTSSTQSYTHIRHESLPPERSSGLLRTASALMTSAVLRSSTRSERDGTMACRCSADARDAGGTVSVLMSRRRTNISIVMTLSHEPGERVAGHVITSCYVDRQDTSHTTGVLLNLRRVRPSLTESISPVNRTEAVDEAEQFGRITE